ncbi:hypothetical protein BDN70DRAFT_918728 [Pholiota conissans]|uniref:F-box domain-containing protein n=1 Tax=Pholiota conissans TaxID=109636 RepID=A0A9P5Z8T4_9AGAR|nr:hypothetical protein BDN70DRAFT_918728 [Pholiota conissans]
MTEHVAACPSLAKGLSCTPCEDLVTMDQEILIAEEIVVKLKLKRKEICKRRNNVHDLLTSRLPPEVVSRIFIKFLPASVSRSYSINMNRRKPFDELPTTTPFLLGSVSTRWRAVTLSTPPLWTSISIDLTYTSEAFAILLQEWLERSGGLRLYLNIYATDLYPILTPSQPLMQISMQISNVLATCMPRWYYLLLEVPSTFFPCICTGVGSAPQLNTLDVRVHGSGRAPIKLESIPNLKCLSIFHFDIRTILNVSWKKLTHFDGAFPSVDMVHQLFLNALFLEHCIFYLFGGLGHNQRRATRNTVIQHDHLVFLRIRYWAPGTDTALAWLTFPALQHLVSNKQTRSLADLIGRSLCLLKTLELFVDVKYEDQEVQLIPLVADIPSLETLCLKDRSDQGRNRYSIDSLLLKLSETSSVNRTQQSFLPNLKVLDLSLAEFSWISLLGFLTAYSNTLSHINSMSLEEGSQEREHDARSLKTINIRLWNNEGTYFRPDSETSQKLQSAAEDTSLQVNITDSYDSNHVPLAEFLQFNTLW